MSEVNPYQAPNAVGGAGSDESYQPSIFSFSGRIGRLRYLAYGFLWTSIFYAVLLAAMLFGGVFMAMSGESSGGGATTVIGIIIAIIAYVGMIAVAFSLIVRRLNDMDASGWLSLLMLVPFVGLILVLVLVFAPGTRGENKYGAPPCKNSVPVIIGALVLPFAIIGILAAVAIPAYQGYVERAEAAQLEFNP